MKKFIIDSNALISFVTDRNPKQQTRIAELFERAAGLKAALMCPQNVLTEFVSVTERIYGISREDINRMLGDFIATPGVMLVHEVDMELLLKIWPQTVTDYGDAIVASVGKSIKGLIVATFDKRFRTSLKKMGVEVFPS